MDGNGPGSRRIESSPLTRRQLLATGSVMGVMGIAGCSSSDKEADMSAFREPGEEVDADVVIYWFWGDGCPHCADQKPFMEELAERDGVEVVAFEVYNNEENREVLEEFVTAYGIEREGVPLTFIGTEYWVGYAEKMEAEMKAQVETCLESDCPHPADPV